MGPKRKGLPDHESVAKNGPMKRAIFCILFALVASVACAQSQTATEPEDLKKLRESWQRARQQVVAPLDRKYTDALLELMARLVKAGKLDQAVVVDAEIKKLSSGEPNGKWHITTEVLTSGAWTFQMAALGKQTYVFTPDHKMSVQGVMEGTWKITGGTLHVEPGKHWCDFVVDTSSVDGAKALTEINSDAGKRKDYSLTLQQKR
jgi:hypothetical protein